ncbi:gamma-glutamylcyclotransferase family protein [Nocardia stercoris]|nr:gamma-glutamylcyclotransferase family protein [Nocardia stercoris]
MSSTASRGHEDRSDIFGPDGQSSMPLFAYGTLQASEVMKTLIGRVPDHRPAELEGWTAARLPDRVYPGLVRRAGQRISGQLVTGLTPAEWMLLDRFEDTDYVRELLQLTDGTKAWTYVWQRDTEAAVWDLDEFLRSDLPDYVVRCSAWLTRDRAR